MMLYRSNKLEDLEAVVWQHVQILYEINENYL